MTDTDFIERARNAARSRWSLPRACHAGELDLGGGPVEAYVLDDNTRVVTIKTAAGALSLGEDKSREMVRIMGHKLMADFVSDELVDAFAHPIEFLTPGRGYKAKGVDAKRLVEFMHCVVKANASAPVVPAAFRRIANACSMAMADLATLGIIALVDEVTGYQDYRARDELHQTLRQLISDRAARWVKVFPGEYYSELDRLIKGGDERPERADCYGKLTREMVYRRLGPGVMEMLEHKNPIIRGRRKHAHHSWLTTDIGVPELREHLSRLIAMMRMCPDGGFDHFMSALDRHYPAHGPTDITDPGVPAMVRARFDDEDDAPIARPSFDETALVAVH